MSASTPSESLPVPPSGRQVEIRHGGQRATVVEVGGGVRTYVVDGVQVLDGYDLDEMCSAARGQPLIPWPNRLHEGRYEWDGERYQAPINEASQHNAIHGFTRWRNWTVTATGDETAVATLRMLPQQGYPFALDLTVEYALGPSGLTVTTTARNVGPKDCPYGHGAHPYIAVGTESLDEAVLRLPASSYLPTDEDQIPTGTAPVEGSPYDFRSPRPIGDVAVDYAFTDLERDQDGLAWVQLSSPDGTRTVGVWADESYPYLEIFTGDTLVPERRRRGLGVEPMTCPPNAFATGEGVRRLSPGESVTTRWGIQPSGI